MVKVYLLSFVLCGLLPGIIVAQPTLTPSIAPAAGTLVTLKNGPDFDPGNSGASQTWDLSGLSAQDSVSSPIDYETPGSTPYAGDFAGTNLTFNYSNGGAYEYFNSTSSVIQLWGIYTQNIPITYSNPEDFMRFPFNYTDTYTDAFVATLSNGGVNFLRYGTVTVTADGYGTLILPDYTYSNAMRVHFHEVYEDSANIQGIPEVIPYDNDQYLWYVEGFPFFVATTYQLTQQGFTNGHSFYALHNTANGIAALQPNEDFKLYPVPANNNINIQPAQGSSLTKLEVLDLSGRQLAVQQAEAIHQSVIPLSISAYPAGAYLVRLTYSDGNSVTRKFIVE